MNERRVLIDGFPPRYNSAKAKTLLENHCGISISGLVVQNSRAEVLLANDQDVEILRQRYPRSLQYGGQNFSLKLQDTVGTPSQSPIHCHGPGYQQHGSQFASDGRTQIQHRHTDFLGGYPQTMAPPHNISGSQASDMRYPGRGTSSQFAMDQNRHIGRQEGVHGNEQMNIRGQAQQMNVGTYQPLVNTNYSMTAPRPTTQETQPFGPHSMPGADNSPQRTPWGSMQGDSNTIGMAPAGHNAGYQSLPMRVSGLNEEFHRGGSLKTSSNRGQNPGPIYQNYPDRHVRQKIVPGPVTDHQCYGQSDGSVDFGQPSHNYPDVGYRDGSAPTGHKEGLNSPPTSRESSYQTLSSGPAFPAFRSSQNFSVIGGDGYGHNTTYTEDQHLLPQTGLGQKMEQSAMSDGRQSFVQPSAVPRMGKPQESVTQSGGGNSDQSQYTTSQSTEDHGQYAANLGQSDIRITSFSNNDRGHTDLPIAHAGGYGGQPAPVSNPASLYYEAAAYDDHSIYQQTHGRKFSQHGCHPAMVGLTGSTEEKDRDLWYLGGGDHVGAESRGIGQRRSGEDLSDPSARHGHGFPMSHEGESTLPQAEKEFACSPGNRGRYDVHSFQQGMRPSPRMTWHQFPITTPQPEYIPSTQPVYGGATTPHDGSSEYTSIGTGGMASSTPAEIAQKMASHGTVAHMSGMSYQSGQVPHMGQDYNSWSKTGNQPALNRDAAYGRVLYSGHRHTPHDPTTYESHSMREYHHQHAPNQRDEQHHQNAPATSLHDKDSQLPPAPPPQLCVDKVYNWSTVDLPDNIGTSGLLVNEIPAELSPENLVNLFVKSGAIKLALSMIDGMLIIFDRPSDLRRVVDAKQRNVRDSSIRVFEKKIPMQYRDRFVLKNFKHVVDEIGEDVLKMTLKNCSLGKYEPQKLTKFGNNFMLIVYDQEPDDLQAIKDEFIRKVRRKDLQVLPLRMTDCLRVCDGPSGVNFSPVAIQAVLENRDHGGGNVTRIDQLRDGSYLVYFSSSQDVEKLYKNLEDERIEIKGHKFKIDLYFHLLSNDHRALVKKHEMDEYYAKWRDSESAPETFWFTDVNPDVLKFLSDKRGQFQFLESSLQDLAIAKIQTTGFEITPDLDSPQTRNRPRDHSEFKTECITKIEQFLNDYSSEKKKFSEENLLKVRQLEPNSKVATHYLGDEEVSMRWSGPNSTILTVTGLKSRVKSTMEDIIQLTDLKSQELKLSMGKYKFAICCDLLAQVKKNHPVGCVGVNKTSTISFTGVDHVTEARCELMDLLMNVTDQKFNPSDGTQIEFFSDPRHHDAIVQKAHKIFRKNKIKAILTIEGETVRIWSNDNDKMVAAGVMKDSLASDKSIALPTSARKEPMVLDDFMVLMDKVQKDQMVKITINELAVTIGGFKDDVEEARKKVSKFIVENLKRTEQFLTNYGNALSLVHYNTEFKAVCKRHNIDYELRNDGIILRAKQAALPKVIEQLKKWNARIKYQKEVVKQFKIVEYLESDSNKEKLANTSAQYKCTILVGDSGWPPENSGKEAHRRSLSNFGPLLVNVHGGDITEEKNDAIVNAVGSDFDLSKGQVSQAILRKSGAKIQQEVLQGHDADLRVTTAKGMHCKLVLHVVSPKKVEGIKDCVMKILMEAEKQQCVSVSIPAIGTGQLGLSATAVAKLMLQTLMDFATEYPQTKRLKIVDLVIFQPQMLADFRSVFVPEQKDENTRQSPPDPVEQEGNTTSSATGTGVITVSVHQGDITNEKTDAIVNSTGADFILSKGLVSKMILSKGGSQIQQDVSAVNGKLVRVTSGGQLACNHIIHAVAPDKVEAIKDRLLDVLREAEKCQCSSLSIPAIGTGNLGLQSSSVANIMKEAFLEVPTKLPFIRSLRTVNVVIFEQSMVQDFQSVLTMTVNVSTSKGTHSSSNFQRQPSSVAGQVGTPSSNNSFGSLQVTVRQGDITDETNDAIVNSTGSDFDLTQGMVSKAIVRKGGQQIQQELSAEKDFSLRVTGGGNLKCGKIFHVVAPIKVERLKDCLINIFYEAERQHCKSLSLPAIGTGNLNLPPANVAKIMSQALNEFALKKPQTTSLKIVDVVIYEQRFIQDFQAELATGTAAVSTATGSLPPRSSTPPPVISIPNTISSSSATIGPITLSVRQGDITEESNDAIVNSTGADFNLSQGLVSRAILKKGGQEIQQQVSSVVGNKLRVTTGGKLKCKNILHAVAPDNIDKIKQCIINILEQAELQQCASLSIPAIGTGNLGLASNDVAKLMSEAFHDFAKACPQTKTLKKVDVVIYETAKLADFETGLIHPSPVDSSKKTGVFGAMRSAMSTIGGKVSETLKSMALGPIGTLHTTLQQLKVSVCQGNIVQEDKDAIVNIAFGGFNLSEGVMSATVLANAGQQIQDELNKMTDPELRVTSPGNLNCKKIVHVVVPYADTDIRSLLKRILKEAESQGCTSISIPPIGADQGLSDRLIANLMLGEMQQFAPEAKSLHDIDIVITPKGEDKLLKYFERAITLQNSHLSANIKRPADGKGNDRDSVTIHFYCEMQDGLDKARKSVMESLNQDFFKDFVQDPSISTLTDIETEDIAKVAETHDVRLVYNRTEEKIYVDGLRTGVWNAVKAIQRSLHEFSEARTLKSFTSYFWQYRPSHRHGKPWRDFTPQADKTLEQLFQTHQSNGNTGTSLVKIHFEGLMEEFTVDFECMMIDGYDKFAIRRETKDDFPKNWDRMKDTDMFREVELSSDSPEYKDAENMLTATVPKCQIVSISRVQNKNMYIRYKNQKRQISRLANSKKIERKLFHGTNASVVDKIKNYGFDRNYAGDKNAAFFGKGAYFAVNANYSDHDKYATADGADGVKTMILADVLTGDYCKGEDWMKSAPQKPNSDIVYDSLVDDESNPTIFVVFPDASMYPAYVIKYKK